MAAWRTTAAALIRKHHSRICNPAAPPAADNKDHKQSQGSVATLLQSHRKGRQRSCVSDFQVLQHALVDRVFRHQRQIQILLSHFRFMTTAVNSGEDPNKQMRHSSRTTSAPVQEALPAFSYLLQCLVFSIWKLMCASTGQV